MMKQILVCICLLLAITGCDKKPINGKLDGRWQLMTIEYNDGSTEECNRIYYSIQLHLVEIINQGNNNSYSYMGHFNYDDEVVMGEFRIRGNEDVVVSDAELKPFGLNSSITRLKVEKATSKAMILKSDYARLTFRKF